MLLFKPYLLLIGAMLFMSAEKKSPDSGVHGHHTMPLEIRLDHDKPVYTVGEVIRGRLINRTGWPIYVNPGAGGGLYRLQYGQWKRIQVANPASRRRIVRPPIRPGTRPGVKLGARDDYNIAYDTERLEELDYPDGIYRFTISVFSEHSLDHVRVVHSRQFRIRSK